MVNRANGPRANDHKANGNRADVVAPILRKIELSSAFTPLNT